MTGRGLFLYAMTERDDDAWRELYEAIPRGWVVGRLPFDKHAHRWRLYGYHRASLRRGTQTPLTVEAESEEQAVRDMTRKLKDAAPDR